MSVGGGGAIEEVGARLVLMDVEGFKAGFADATKSVRTFTRALKSAEDQGKLTADSLRAVADSAKASAGTVAAAAGEQSAAMKASADKTVEATATQKASLTEAQKSYDKAAAGYALAQKRYAAAHEKAWQTTLSKAGAFSNKILKVGGAIGGFAIYEGVKSWMTFQQQMSQEAIDAGIRRTQLPAFENAALRVSNATGVAATGIAQMMYRIASANPHLQMSVKQMNAMANAAGQLAVLSGPTGNTDSIGRMYGAIVANHLALTQGGKALAYNAAGGRAINEWALQVAGHGDVYTSQLVGALGTGVLPVASALHLSLNQLGGMLDVLFPAMGASAASTRTKTALGMLAAPSTITGPLYSMTGGTALSIGQAMLHGGPVAAMAVLNKMLHTRLTSASAANYYNAFYGGGLGTFHGGSKGKATGAIAFLRAHGFSEAQIRKMERSPEGISAVPAAANYLVLHSFGAGHAGAAVLQWLDAYRTHELQNKITAIRGGQTKTAYERELSIAYAQPMRQWDIFYNKLKNLSIEVGRDVTPAFDGFLHTLEGLGRWFGANKWALDALGGAAGGVLGGAALIKIAQMGVGVLHGAQAFGRVIVHPIATVKSIFSRSAGAAGLDGAAADLIKAAAALDEAAAVLRASGGKPGMPGGTPSPVTTLENDAEHVAEGTGIWETAKFFAKKGARILTDPMALLGGYALYSQGREFTKVPFKTDLKLGKTAPGWLTGPRFPGETAIQHGAYDVVHTIANPMEDLHSIAHGFESLFGLGGAHKHAVTHHASSAANIRAALAQNRETSQTNRDASNKQADSATRFADAVNVFGHHVVELNTSLSDGAVHAKATRGARQAAARR